MKLHDHERKLCFVRSMLNKRTLQEEIDDFQREKERIRNANDNRFTIQSTATIKNEHFIEIRMNENYHKVLHKRDIEAATGGKRLTQKQLLEWLHTKDGTNYLLDTPHADIHDICFKSDTH